MAQRLSKQDWIKHGLSVLKTKGPSALKADRMVKALGVTRGSFYWHFADMDGFTTALLDAWRDQITQAVIAELGKLPDGPAQLRELIRRVLVTPQGLEAAIRHWADSNPKVARAVEDVDALRLDYVARTFRNIGLTPEAAAARAALFRWAYIGRAISPGADDETLGKFSDHIADLLIQPQTD